ncbi:MAG: phosphatase PAP2 family protein [Chthoniobacterales bacterium]|nr:phosphatase PAP2 family protein [Chthoniobacterales bacterium]
MTSSCIALDHLVQHWVNQVATTRFLDYLMAAMTNFSAWRPVFIVLIVVALLFGKFHLRAMLCCLALTIAITDGVVVRTLKHFVERPRPFQSEVGVRHVRLLPASPQIKTLLTPPEVSFSLASEKCEKGFSFPSSHAANIVATAIVLSLFYWRARWFFWLIAFLVMYSRLYTGAHWPSDILAGFFIGMTMPFLVVSLLEKIWERFGIRLAPELARRHPTLRELGAKL